MVSPAQANATKKYLEKFQDIKIRVPLGQRELMQQYAQEQGLSLNAYIYKLISDDMGERLTEKK